MFYLTATEYGHSYIAETYETIDDAYAAIDAMENAIDDGQPSYLLACSIAELKEQIADYLMALDDNA